MKKTTLDEAIFEAKRFIDRAETLKNVGRLYRDFEFCGSPKEQGAVKRTSLDLARKLADLRAGR